VSIAHVHIDVEHGTIHTLHQIALMLCEHQMFDYFVEFHSSIGLWFDQEMDEMHDLILKKS
jgi:hypothetical protein